MKVLYAIQGTGNGHLARAIQLIPSIREKMEVDVLLSGIQGDLKLPFEVKYQCYGLSFIFGKNGGIDILKTISKLKPLKLIREISSLPVKDYDLIISDFEPVSGWAGKVKGVPVLSLSHQVALLSKNIPLPRYSSPFAKLILKHYAPFNHKIGFHFDYYDKHTFAPIIRSEIRNAHPTNKPYYTVYLPAFGDDIVIDILSKISSVEWVVFSKHASVRYQKKNVRIEKVDNLAFTQSIINCTGVLCGAGFETPAEALFLGKKLVVIPMKNQFEQHYNAAALFNMGVTVLNGFSRNEVEQLENWVNSKNGIRCNYKDEIDEIIKSIIQLIPVAPVTNVEYPAVHQSPTTQPQEISF